MIEMTERSEKGGELKDNKPVGDQNYTPSELSANSKSTRAGQHRDDVREKRRRLAESVIDWCRCLRKNPEEVKRRIRQGVPDWSRGIIWQLISGGVKIQLENPAVDYAQLISSEMSEFENLRLFKDVPRTLRSLALSQTYARSIYEVLKAYDVYDRARAGYIHGMSYIVGVLLLYMNEEEAFWTMVAMLNKPAMRGIYSERAPLFDQYIFQFGMLVKEQLPTLNQHLEEQRILPSMYARRWFLTVFSADLPISLVVRIWDVFLYEGMDFIFQVGLALLKFFKKDLLKLTKERLIEFLVTLKTKEFRTEILLEMALSFDVHKRLPELELDYRRKSVTLQEFLIFNKKQ